MTNPNPNVSIEYRGYSIAGTMAAGFVWGDGEELSRPGFSNVEAAMISIDEYLTEHSLRRGPIEATP